MDEGPFLAFQEYLAKLEDTTAYLKQSSLAGEERGFALVASSHENIRIEGIGRHRPALYSLIGNWSWDERETQVLKGILRVLEGSKWTSLT